MNEEKPPLTWEQIKGITRGQIIDLEGRTINPEDYSNTAKLGDSTYILASSIPEGIADTLQDREEIQGQQYGNLNSALELANKGETDEGYLYKDKGIEELISEKSRLIPVIIEQQVFYGLELTLTELEGRYFENTPEQFIAGKILLQRTLDQKFDAYILRRKQQQLEKEKEKLAKETDEGRITPLQKREKLAQYLKDKLFDIKTLSYQELKNIDQFSFETLNPERRTEFLDKIKNNYNRLQQYTDEFLDLINVIVIPDITIAIQQQILRIATEQQALELIARQETNTYYQAERQAIEQGLLVRLFRQIITEEKFASTYKKTPEQMQADIKRRKTPFQRRLGREILDKFLPVDLEEEKEEKQILVDINTTKQSVRKSYLFGNETDELGVIRHNLSAKDIVGVGEIFDQAQRLMQPRIEAINLPIVFEDAYLNSLKTAWMYANAAILDWVTKTRQKQKELNMEKTGELSTTLNKIVKKIQTGTATPQDYKMLAQLQKKTMDVAGRDKMIDEDIVGIFDKKTRNDLMKELQEGEQHDQ